MISEVISFLRFVYGIKTLSFATDTAKNILLEELALLTEASVECVILGCTELPSALTQDMVSISLLDATNVLARALIQKSNPDALI